MQTNPITPRKGSVRVKTSKLKLDNINVGEVGRAAWPNFVGTTPALDKSPVINMKSKLTKKNIFANERSRSLMHSLEFK